MMGSPAEQPVPVKMQPVGLISRVRTSSVSLLRLLASWSSATAAMAVETTRRMADEGKASACIQTVWVRTSAKFSKFVMN